MRVPTGCTVEQWIPRPRSSSIIARPIIHCAAFVAQYAPQYGIATFPMLDEQISTCPRPTSSIRPCAARTMFSVPKKFVSKIALSCPSLVVWLHSSIPYPAFAYTA